jgi:polyhydroxyalkanoate synthesis regulator phasin
MPQSPDLSKYLDAGVEFVAMTRSQARARAKELVTQGHLAQSQVQGFVDDLVDESRRRTDLVMDVVRQEIQRQVKTLGIATKDDLAKLEAKIARQKSPAKGAKRGAATAEKSGKGSAKSGTKKSGTKKAGTKKAGAKKAGTKKAGTKKAATGGENGRSARAS